MINQTRDRQGSAGSQAEGVGSQAEGLWLWAGTLAHATLAERVEAAVAGGFSSLTLFPADYRRAREQGSSDREILDLHSEHGVRLRTLDPYARWVPRFAPPQSARDRLAIVDTREDEFFAIAEALELETMTAIEPFGTRYPAEALAESFAALCDRAARSGLRVHLEFTPFSGIPDLATAWETVRLANRRNGGIAFDTWHYLRGRRDDRLLREIPGEQIFVVQVNDAAAEVRGSLLGDTWRHRMLPGEGSFDLDGVLEILLAKPGVGPIGIEVLSESLWRLPPAELGRRCGASLREALERPRA